MADFKRSQRYAKAVAYMHLIAHWAILATLASLIISMLCQSLYVKYAYGEGEDLAINISETVVSQNIQDFLGNDYDLGLWYQTLFSDVFYFWYTFIICLAITLPQLYGAWNLMQATDLKSKSPRLVLILLMRHLNIQYIFLGADFCLIFMSGYASLEEQDSGYFGSNCMTFLTVEIIRVTGIVLVDNYMMEIVAYVQTPRPENMPITKKKSDHKLGSSPAVLEPGQIV